MNIFSRSFLSLLMMVLTLSVQALSVEQDKDAEIQKVIDDTNTSNIFASWIFSGGFAKASFSGVNPEYKISQGDTLLIQLWGGVDYQAETKVDPQGNIFIPKVGPIKVLGVSNKALNKVILKSVKRVYRSNVEAYVSLLSTQRVKVFLSGLVKKPGLYEGQSADSVLRFIDQAGGIRNDIGSYRQIQVKRNNKSIAQIDLYKFITQGEMPVTQLQDGDVIFVGSRKGEVTVEGEVGFQGRYELQGGKASLASVVNAVVADEKATHVTVVEPKGSNVEAVQYSINDIQNQLVTSGALIKVSSQLRATSISVEVVGEHASEFEMVLPWGATLSDLLAKVEYTKLSNKNAIQLYRQSVAVRQKEMLMASLSALEQNVLTTRSATNEAANLRKTEAGIVLQWIEKAKDVDPKGQVLLTQGYDPKEVILQQGDRIVVPSKKSLVLVHGEVLFPTAIAYRGDMDAEDFINKAGGTNGSMGDMNILLMKPNGSFVDINSDLTDEDEIHAGDEIFVLPEPDIKSLQLTKDISQVIYQIAVSAAVVLAL